jgi:hypothetical protein
VRNLRTRRATQIGPAGIKSISGDGHLVGFSSHATNLTPGDANNADDVFVHNLSAHTTTLVSRASGADGALGNNFSDGVALTADGRFVLRRDTPAVKGDEQERRRRPPVRILVAPGGSGQLAAAAACVLRANLTARGNV